MPKEYLTMNDESSHNKINNNYIIFLNKMIRCILKSQRHHILENGGSM